MSEFSLNQLPLEILLGIFCYLDVPNILRIRRVSRYLNDISHARDVWSVAYRTANFVRPPGPFLLQSAHDLEHALVPSFRIDRNLRPHGGDVAQRDMPTLRKLREIRYTGVDLRVSLVFGRFLFVALSQEVRCYDLNINALDSNSGASVVYRARGGTLKTFHSASAIDVDGRPFACVVLSEAARTGPGHRTHIAIYRLHVAERSEVTLGLLHQFEHSEFNIRSVDLGPRVIIVQGMAPHEDWRVIALDVHAPTQYFLPPFTDAEWESDEASQWTATTPLTSISTSTHLLLARSIYTLTAGWKTYFQAFALPLNNPIARARRTPLSHSHRGIIAGINVRDVVLLHDAIVDPSTHDTLIMIRVHAFEPSRPHIAVSKYGTLRLGRLRTAPSPDGRVGSIAFQLLGSLGQLSRTPFFHPSFNGTGRAFYTPEPCANGTIAALEYDLRGDGGSDDNPVTKVIEYPCVIRFQTQRVLSDYDPYSGRICLQSTMAKYRLIEILDLAV